MTSLAIARLVRGAFSLLLLALFASAVPAAADKPATQPATAPATAPAFPLEKMAGNWFGTLKVGAVELRLGIKIAMKDGKLTGTMDSMDQGSGDIPIDAATVEGLTFKFVMLKIFGSYEGQVDSAGATIDGTWTQMGQKSPLALKRVDEFPTLKRPQEPKKPYPYLVEEEVSYTSAPGVKLAATLTLPKGKGPFPAVVLISGSGPQDRDEFLLGHRPFLVLADHLTRAGIAVLRADDRGIAKSTGNFATATDEDFAVDALAGVAYLKTRSEIDGKKIGLVGHSEGGVIGPMAAVKSPDDIAFVVMLAGVGVPIDELLVRQGGDILKAEGVPDELIQRIQPMRREMFKLLKEDGTREEITKRIQEIAEKVTAELNEKEKAILKKLEQGSGEAMLQMLFTPWFRQLVRYEPAATLSKVKCPVLAINGEKDLQVSPKENLAGIKAALDKGGNPDVEIVEFPRLNHLFQHSNTGSVSEYGKIEETFAPEAMEKVSGWILRHTRDPR